MKVKGMAFVKKYLWFSFVGLSNDFGKYETKGQCV